MTMRDELKRILLEACVLVAFAVLFGLMLHHQLLIDAFSGRLNSPLVETSPRGDLLPQPVLLDDVRRATAEGLLLVDARTPELFAAGHIAGAISLPLAEFEQTFPAFREQVSERHGIISYCSGYGCPDSYDLAVRLLAAGYRDVRVFEGGFPEWRDAGLPVTEGTP
jgi:rhodanese-related sulfurtransferase